MTAVWVGPSRDPVTILAANAVNTYAIAAILPDSRVERNRVRDRPADPDHVCTAPSARASLCLCLTIPG